MNVSKPGALRPWPLRNVLLAGAGVFALTMGTRQTMDSSPAR